MQFSGQLNTCRPATHDSNIHFAAGAQVRGILEEQIQHLRVETTRLMRVIEEDAIIFHARRVEVVGSTTQRHHQGVVRDLTLGNQQLAFVVTQF
ncbi:hypothetical protein D3C75_855320 [compost metagenome]